ncbi:class I SAM-dependent methyltransferase [Sporomusa termitida]|uniref:Ubiquinone/menaquinone biosynthesis C-methyltransferase UbiE n=1 Tax=Sporomusa termitida TaxID=2377 RepID=A0A517DPH6_9FIRM|nr:class I SAM-dependent methyltransferase [Sporomusa termitida]QDR79263.1 Ubiquinone/menaquinone biosynthesis C-methyltransferase UbiE [Sporomusa termitida]
MAVHLTLDNGDLADTYEAISDTQFTKGCSLVAKLAIKPGAAVLDIGCGTGRLGRHVLSLLGPAGRLVGIDPLPDRVNIAKEKNEYANAVFQAGNAEDLSPFADSSFDKVYLNSVFHWILNKDLALREISRVLKPGGTVGITTGARELNTVTGLQIITDTVLRREPYRQIVNIAECAHIQHGLTTTGLLQLLAAAGFRVDEVQIQNSVQVYQTPREVTLFQEASCFGNYLNHVPVSLRAQAKADIEAELERNRTGQGIQFGHYTIFAVATKEE